MNETFLSLCAERLTEERQRLGLKQVAAAALCKVSREVWGRYERGLAAPGGEVLMHFARAGADVQYILTGRRDAPPPEVLTSDERELLDLFRAAPLAVKAAAMGALQGAASTRGTRITAGGKVVGQVVEGDLVNQGPVVIGKNRGKKK